jgi:uncharacterized repeat protein (TIGR03806 family)
MRPTGSPRLIRSHAREGTARSGKPAVLLACLLPLAACGDDLEGEDPIDVAEEEVCRPPDGEAAFFDLDQEPCRFLSSYRFFADGPGQVAGEGVVPYEVNSALFSDYASKHRFLFLSAPMAYQESGVFDLPVGSVLIKTFAYRADLRAPDSVERLVETRLLVHSDAGWEGLVYVWDDEQSDAHLQVAGGIVPVEWIDAGGDGRSLEYIVPNINQCENCHVADDSAQPIGIQARHLNRDYAYPDGSENQLAALSASGLLEGAPADPAEAPRAAVWDDPESGTVEERTRAWLDINCAHCHSPTGPARTSGLDLRAEQVEPSLYGVCKTPVAAGAGSGGRQYGIVPGQPDESILVYRLESVEPAVRMPEILRQTVHQESLTLVRDWVRSLEGDCAPPE